MRISDWSSDVCSSDLIKSGVTSWGRALLAQLTDVEDINVGIILILARHRPDEGIGFRARAHMDRPGRRNHSFLILHDAVARRLALANEMHESVGIDIVGCEIEIDRNSGGWGKKGTGREELG